MSEKFEKAIEDINTNLSKNYESVQEIFNKAYGYPEFDPVRDEICKCIIFGLHQAAITLTNHLLESSLKKCLIYKYTINNKEPNNTDIATIFKEAIEKFDNDKSDLSKSINSACSIGLIDKKQKSLLHDFRERFRNSYSHASSKKTFIDLKIPGKMVSISTIKEAFEPIDNELTVKDIPMIQGIVQAIISSNDSLMYFKEIDKIIRDMLNKLKK